ncbi:hypothetical protein J6590_077467 [Homalodisca vitripennis]|nr:hypothetical protein J6590_077467 [Homalodisca vitripennis]
MPQTYKDEEVRRWTDTRWMAQYPKPITRANHSYMTFLRPLLLVIYCSVLGDSLLLVV